MAISFRIVAGSGAADPNAANVVLRAGCCTGTPSGALALAELASGQDPTSSTGYGPLASAAAQASRLGGAKHYALKITATEAGTISAVTESPAGTGPTVTVVGSAFDGLTSPWDALSVKAKVSTAGPVGTAVVDIAIDGASYNYRYPVPAEAKATVTGTVNLKLLTLATLNALTLIVTSDLGGPTTCTFTTPTDIADIAVQVNAALTAIATARIIGGDKKYLQIESKTPGGSSTLLVAAASTADLTLGMSNTAASGGASTITIPGTGLVLTFPATSDYVLSTIYGFTTTAPRFSLADLDTALALVNADTSVKFGLLEVIQEPADGADLAAYVVDQAAVVAAWEAQPDKRFVTVLLGAPLDATDSAIKTALQGSAATRKVTVAGGDIWTTSATPSPKGIVRRSLCRPLGIRCASKSLSEDPGFGGFGALPECQAKSPDGASAMRNEYAATTKLGTSTGPGFTVGCLQDGKPFFVRGVTRAGAGDIFVDLGVTRMADYAASLIFASLRKLQNKTFDLNPDGTLQKADADSLASAFQGTLYRALVLGKHASAVRVTVDEAEKVSQTRSVTVGWKVQERGQGEDINGTLTLVGELTVTG
ncbi:MAG: hypothetical protein ABI193_12745 [Minicystis sp.]